jgi:hypothetical protein
MSHEGNFLRLLLKKIIISSSLDKAPLKATHNVTFHELSLYQIIEALQYKNIKKKLH